MTRRAPALVALLVAAGCGGATPMPQRIERPPPEPSTPDAARPLSPERCEGSSPEFHPSEGRHAAPILTLAPLTPDDEELGAHDYALAVASELGLSLPAISADGTTLIALESGQASAPFADVQVLDARTGDARERVELWSAREAWQADDGGLPGLRAFHARVAERLGALAGRLSTDRMRTLQALGPGDPVLRATPTSIAICTGSQDRFPLPRAIEVPDDTEDCTGMVLDRVDGVIDRATGTLLVRVSISGQYGMCPEVRWHVYPP